MIPARKDVDGRDKHGHDAVQAGAPMTDR